MGKICLFCMEEYKNDEIMSPYKTSDAGLYQDCPKRACEGKVYNIDDSLVSTITVLNSKGYPTYSSCAGHHLEQDTECYIEFTEDVKSIPELPEGFKLRMKSVGDKSRLAIYRRPKAEDPIDQFSELMEFAEILYEWAIHLEFNIQGLDIVFIDLDLDDSPFGFLDISPYGPNKEDDQKTNKKTKKKLDVDKLKESAPTASIKLKRAEEEKEVNEQIVDKDPAKESSKDTDPTEENKEDTPKKKRGRPKKN